MTTLSTRSCSARTATWTIVLALCLPLAPLKAEKVYKLVEDADPKAAAKAKPPEPSKPVDPFMFKKFIVVDVSAQKATYYELGEIVFSTPVSTGREDKSTREGVYHVTKKHKYWVSTIYDVPMPYFLRLNDGDVGLHAGYLPGYPASHGCIRLPKSAAMHLFEIVSVGTPVVIQGKAPDKEWIKAQYLAQKSNPPSTGGYSRGKTGEPKNTKPSWQPPYPIIPLEKDAESEKASASKKTVQVSN